MNTSYVCVCVCVCVCVHKRLLHIVVLCLMQAEPQVARNMFQIMLRVHAMSGEGEQAVALLKAMRSTGLTPPPSFYSLMVQAFIQAGTLQVSKELHTP